jgi:hypothetical protein
MLVFICQSLENLYLPADLPMGDTVDGARGVGSETGLRQLISIISLFFL